MVSSVTNVPRSFSPANVSVANTAPPTSMSITMKSVSALPSRAPATSPADATFTAFSSAKLCGWIGKPASSSTESRRSRRMSIS